MSNTPREDDWKENIYQLIAKQQFVEVLEYVEELLAQERAATSEATEQRMREKLEEIEYLLENNVANGQIFQVIHQALSEIKSQGKEKE